MITKIIGSVCVLLACTGFGLGIATSHRKETRCLRDLICVLSFMECELEYRVTALPELMDMASNICSGPVSRFFKSFSTELKSQIQPDINLCMQAALGATTDIPASCKDGLLQLNQTLGSFGLLGQLEGIRAVRNHCEQQLQNKLIDQDKHLRSYETLGICAGAALVIILM